MSSGFYNSVNGDRKYNASDLSFFYGSLITSGVMPNPSTNLQVRAKQGMTVEVLPGTGWSTPHYFNNPNNFEITLDPADPVLNRYDVIIMKDDMNMSVRDMHLEYKKGTAATQPKPAEMVRTSAIKEYCLCKIYIPAGGTSISQTNITDTRADTTVCGWVTSLIKQVDTSELFIQWQQAYKEFYEQMEGWEDAQKADFERWVEELKGILSGDVAGNLATNKVDIVVTSKDIPISERKSKTFYFKVTDRQSVQGETIKASPAVGYRIL